MMEEFGPGYRQILTLSMPALESVAGPDETPVLSRLANNCMAELVARRPDRFPGFVASLGLNNVAAALHEMRRSIEELGAIGIQLFTNVGGRPLDEPEFWPIFEAIAQHDLPVCCIPPAGPVAPTIPAKRHRSTRSGGRSAGPTRRAWPCRGWSSRSSSCGCRGSR
jgi:predicted TIM-barrel fold metal-dependent hydrolase